MGERTDDNVTPPFILRHDWTATLKPALYLLPLKNYTLTAAPAGYHQVPEPFQTNELPRAPPRPKKYPPRTGRIIT